MILGQSTRYAALPLPQRLAIARAARTDPNPPAVRAVSRWGRIVWCTILGGSAVVEVIGLADRTHRDDTLSETTRWLWRTDSPVGQWAFRIAWAGFSAWFVPHIAKVTTQALAVRKMSR